MNGVITNTQIVRGEQPCSRLLAFLALLYLPLLAIASGGPVTLTGYVVGRGLVQSNGHYIYVEYADDGTLISGGLHKEAADEYADATVMSGSEYYNLSKQMSFIKQNTPGSKIMTVKEFNAAIDSGSFTVNVPQSDGSYKALPIALHQKLPEDVYKSVLVRSLDHYDDPNGVTMGDLVLFMAPVDLVSGRGITDANNYKSLLISKDGIVLAKSHNDIGLEAAYYVDKNGNPPDNLNQFDMPFGDTLLHPVPNAEVDIPFTSNGKIPTDDKGEFSLPVFIPPCPGFSFNYDLQLYAAVPRRPFSPQKPFLNYYVHGPASLFCDGYGEGMGGSTSLSGLMAQVDAAAITATLSTPMLRIRIPADILEFDSHVDMANAMPVSDGGSASGTVTMFGSDTTYTATTGETSQSAAPNNYGFDANGDGIADQMTSGTDANGNPAVNVCLNPQQTHCTNADADFQRVQDYTPDFNSEGLLSSISPADLKDTDVFIFRVSTGQLLVHQVGLDETKNFVNGKIELRMPVPGPQAANNIQAEMSTTLEAWETSLGLVTALRGRKVDDIRPGEEVEVVILNRPTGYIGTIRTPLLMPGSADNIPVTLYPPNLKVQVTRLYKRNGKDNQQHTVGYRGAATTSDSAVKIRTLWLDHDGLPLPTCSGESECGLSLTGRVAIVDGNQTLSPYGGASSNGNHLATFSINPGAQTQVIMLSGGSPEASLYYLQVSGESKIDAGYFNDPIASGILAHRPKHYVPVRVPVFNEARYNQLRNAAAEAGEDINNVPETYVWPYRPEMAFSVIQLAQQQEQLKIYYKDKTTKTINLSDTSQADLTALLDNNVDYAVLIYGISDSNGTTPVQDLSAVGAAPQEYIFDIGGDEHVATVGSGTHQIKFKNLDSLQDVQGSDLLALSLYMNSDPSNVLSQVEMPGLYVYYEAPSPLHVVLPDKDASAKASSASGNKVTVFRTLGGMRLMLRYQPHEGDEVTGYQWTIKPPTGGITGSWYPDFKSSSAKLSADPTKTQVYWQPDSWKLSQGTTSDTFTGTLSLGIVGQTKSTIIHFNIVRRELAPPSGGDPMEGQDVRMLEGVLWHLGLSPQTSTDANNPNAGKAGARIASDRGGSLGPTLLCGSDEKADKRDVYTGNWASCGSDGHVSLEGMVRRFQGRNNDINDSQNVQGGKDATTDGVVNSPLLGQLGKVWKDYEQATEKHPQNVIMVSSVPASWWAGLANIFETGQAQLENGNTVTVSPGATYSDERQANVLTDLGTSDNVTRVDVLKAWARKENNKHWGANGVYRISEGGADEYGSIGFSQLKFEYVYGKMSGRCPSLKDVNMYSPENNLLGFGMWDASSNIGCNPSFYYAFVGGEYDHKYNGAATGSGSLVGYRKADGTIVKLDLTKKITDDYVRLLKALAGYKAGAHARYLRQCSLPDLLVNQPSGHCHKKGSMAGYAMVILHGGLFSGGSDDPMALSLPYRTYIWKGGTYPAGTPNAGKDWCFAYGEKEWMGGITWASTRTAAVLYHNNDSGKSAYSDPRVSCN